MRQFDCKTNYYWFVDDVTVKAMPSCLAPTALSVENITTTSADLSWTSDADAWTVYYKKTTDVSYTEVTNVTENPYTLNGLDASSYYQFYVVANCSENDERVRIHTIQMIAQSPYAHEAVGQTGVQFSRGSSDNDWEEED